MTAIFKLHIARDCIPTLMKVCQLWRECIIDIPSTWAHIYVTVDGRIYYRNMPIKHAPVGRVWKQLDYIVSLARSLPLHITLSITGTEDRVTERKELFSRLIVEHAKKIQTLTIRSTDETPVDAVENSLCDVFVHPLPLLRTLDLVYHGRCHQMLHQLFQSISHHSITFDTLHTRQFIKCLSHLNCGNHIEISSGHHDMTKLEGAAKSLQVLKMLGVSRSTCTVRITMPHLTALQFGRISAGTISLLDLPVLEQLIIETLETSEDVSTLSPRSIPFPRLKYLSVFHFGHEVIAFNLPQLIDCSIHLETYANTFQAKMEQIFGDGGCRLHTQRLALSFNVRPSIHDFDRFSEYRAIESLEISCFCNAETLWDELVDLCYISGKPGARLFPGLQNLKVPSCNRVAFV